MASVRAMFSSARPAEPVRVSDAAERRSIGIEIGLVLAITLGLSGLRSLLSLVDSLLAPTRLADQRVALNVSAAQASLVDLAFQLTNVVRLAAWGGLAVYLLWRSGIGARLIGLDRGRLASDAAHGAGLALLIGVPGLGLYLLSRELGLNLTVEASALTDVWWRLPVLVLAALGNAWAEEVVVVGYLITRLRQLGWGENASLAASAVVRGSYHLYQGFGGFIGNLVMGVVFGRYWQRTNRLWPLVIAHGLIDTVAFLGYALLRGNVGWLP